MYSIYFFFDWTIYPYEILTLQTGWMCVISGTKPVWAWNGTFPGTGCCGFLLGGCLFIGCCCGQMFWGGGVCKREFGWGQFGLGLRKSLWHAGIQGNSKQRPQDHLDLPILNAGEDPIKKGVKRKFVTFVMFENFTLNKVNSNQWV